MVHGTRQNAKKMRNLKCKSTDSRVIRTLNKNLLQQHVVQSSRFEFNGTDVNMFSLPVRIPRTESIDDFVHSLSNSLPENPSQTVNLYSSDCQSTTNYSISQQAAKGVGLDEEHLDFEPEFGEDLADDTEENQLPINSDESTVNFSYSNDRDGDGFTNDNVEHCSISTVSFGHRGEMLPLPESDAEDGRQNEYLPFTYSSTTRTLLDSSSDDMSDESECENSRSVREEDHFRSQTFDNSGVLDNDVNEGAWDITPEEEDKLLHSSGDDSDDYESFTEAEDLVETCQIGNARITLPKFTNIHAETFRGNDLKRINSTARTHTTRNKKKKWDLRYSPEVPPTRVFLDDIGFVSDGSADDEDNRDTVDSNSVESVPQLIVFCNDKKKVVCQTNKREFHREPSKESDNGDGLFKLPLPPPKRPPTRPKRTVCNSEDSGKNLQIKVSNKDALFEQRQENSFDTRNNYVSRNLPDFQEEENSRRFDIADKDDTISIIASTIEGDNIEETSNLSHSESRESATYDFMQLTRTKTESPRCMSYTENRTQNWVQNVPDPEPLLLDQQGEPSQLVQLKSNISIMPPVAPKGNPRVYFGDVPTLFMGLCYFHYFNGKCVRHCKLMHSINKGKFSSKFKRSTTEEVSKAYDFSLEFEMFFKEIYPCFIDTFGAFKMQKKLVSCIEDIFKMGSINKSEAIDIIVKGLEDSGLSFLETIEMISFNVGFLQYPELGDILLDVITRKNNISENWDVIKRIGRAIGQISPAIVKRILTRVTSVYPLDKQLCREIYNVIIKNKMTDLSQIGEEYLAPLRTLAEFRDVADMTSKQTVTIAPTALVHPPMISNSTELLAARIDVNLMKERERYERAVEGLTVRTTTLPNRMAESRRPYFSSHGYNSRNTNYDHFRQDFDNRCFMPQSIQDVLLSRDSALQKPRFSNSFQTGTDKYSTPTSSISNEMERSTPSPSSGGLRFEPPPEIDQYVPETMRKIPQDLSYSTNSPKKNHVPLFKSPSTLPQFRHKNTDITLTPSRPIFGYPYYRDNFKLDKSLHNLLPDTSEHVNINEKDISKLNGAIKTKNGLEFYRLLEQYKSPATLQNFITMTIAHLKSCNELYEVILGLVGSLESRKPDYHKDRYVKGVIEVVIMNLLFEFERRGFWYKAGKLLEKFCDWDSLISSQLFQMFAKKKVTTMGRYILLAKIFAKSQNFHQTYEILQCPSLHLLESCEHWPSFYNAQVDLEQRNAVLTEFFKHGYRNSIVDVSDMYRRIYKYGNIHGYDAHCLFNPMLITIMNENKIILLKHFHPDIDIYYKVMDKNVLRAFTILLSNQLTEEELFVLYELCCERQIYTYFQGGETNITVRNNMMDVELRLILKYYFYKISKTKRLPAGDVIINIKLLESQVCSPKILQKCCRSIKEINDRMIEMLKEDFNIFVNNSKPTIIEINLEQIEDWLRGKEIYCHLNYW